jgi:iron/zinc/copper transport system substrate-binding protein
MFNRLAFILVGAVALIGGLTFYLTSKPTETVKANDELRVVTTNSILEDMVKQVGGSDVEVYSIVKRGTDPHEYEPKPRDISATTEADVIFHNGLNLETGGNGWFKKLTKTANKLENEAVFSASKTVKPQYLTSKGKENEPDPHAWLDLENGIRYVKVITQVLSEKDPKHARSYEQRSAAYVKKLTALHNDAKAKFSDVPENKRLLVTSEGAFKYFSKAYGIKPAFIWEINTESQGTPEQMKQVLAKINNSEVKSLFVESSVSPKSMEKVSKETGLPIYAKIYTDSLAKEGQPGDTYYDMVAWNIENIHAGMMVD